jgi:hypothetical protein
MRTPPRRPCKSCREVNRDGAMPHNFQYYSDTCFCPATTHHIAIPSDFLSCCVFSGERGVVYLAADNQPLSRREILEVATSSPHFKRSHVMPQVSSHRFRDFVPYNKNNQFGAFCTVPATGRWHVDFSAGTESRKKSVRFLMDTGEDSMGANVQEFQRIYE